MAVEERTTICQPSVKHEQKWYYDCDPLIGGLSYMNPLSIVFYEYRGNYAEWQIRTQLDAQSYIDDNVDNSR